MQPLLPLFAHVSSIATIIVLLDLSNIITVLVEITELMMDDSVQEKFLLHISLSIVIYSIGRILKLTSQRVPVNMKYFGMQHEKLYHSMGCSLNNGSTQSF